MAVHYLAEFIFIRRVARCRYLRGVYQFVGDTSQGGYDYDGGLLLRLYNLFNAENAARGTYGRPAEFHYFHCAVFF